MSRAESFQQDADDGASRGLFSKQTKTAPAVHHDEKNPAGNVVERQPLRCCYKLNNLEKTLAMSNTPHIVTATFFRGKPPINILRSRLEETVAANPWLGGRLVQDKESGLAIDVPDADKIDTERLFINVSDDIGLRVNATYSSLVGLLKEHPELTLKSIYKSIGR